MMETTTESRWRRQRRRALAFVYATSLLTGVLAGCTLGPPHAEPHPAFTVRVNVLTGFLFGLGFLWYCSADARLIGRPLIEMARLGVFFCWPAGVPVYLLWAHGLRGLGALLLHGFLLLLTVLCSAMVCGYLVYGEQLLT